MSSANIGVFLNSIVNKKKFLSRTAKKRAKQQGDEIPTILDELRKYDYELREDSDLPRLEYMGAVERYLFGFYEDSIRNSVISVEIGLIVKLNEVLSENEKQRIFQEINRETEPVSFTFGYVVNLASNRKYKVLKGKKIKKTIESLIKQRNIHFHSSTFLSGLIYQQKLVIIPLLEDYLNDMSVITQNKYIKIIPSIKNMNNLFLEKKHVLENLSDFTWCTPNKNLQMVTDEVKNHMNKLKIQSETIIEDVKKDYKKLITIKKRINEIIEDKYMKGHALKILYDSFDVLTHIGIL